jgi:hypothetical protein
MSYIACCMIKKLIDFLCPKFREDDICYGKTSRPGRLRLVHALILINGIFLDFKIFEIFYFFIDFDLSTCRYLW